MCGLLGSWQFVDDPASPKEGDIGSHVSVRIDVVLGQRRPKGERSITLGFVGGCNTDFLVLHPRKSAYINSMVCRPTHHRLENLRPSWIGEDFCPSKDLYTPTGRFYIDKGS